MSSIFINGTKYYISKQLAAALAVTAITNADPAVASAATPPADGSIVLIKSGWQELDETVARTIGATDTAFSLEGVDTSDTNRFVAGAGAGSVQVVSSWSEILQIRTAEISGGEQQYYTYQYLNDKSNRQRQKSTYKNPYVMTLTMDYDQTQDWYQTLDAADASSDPVVVKAVLPNGATILYYADLSFSKIPTQTINENMQVSAALSLLADPVRYDN